MLQPIVDLWHRWQKAARLASALFEVFLSRWAAANTTRVHDGCSRIPKHYTGKPKPHPQALT
jgi:hypothetical protein